MPPWLSIETNRVIGKFVSALVRHPRWRAVYLISPWISEFDYQTGPTFGQLAKRLRDEDATAYVVTRPPVDTYHQQAVERLKETGVEQPHAS